MLDHHPCRRCGSPDILPQLVSRRNYICQGCLSAERAETFRRIYADPARRQRHLARAQVRNAISKGTIVRQPCEVCAASPAEAHHDDYSKPLSVRWLCAAHHRQHHATLKAAIKARAA